MLVKDIRARLSNGSRPDQLTRSGSNIYFYADEGISGKELWRSSGTANGTKIVKDIYPGLSSGIREDSFLVDISGVLFFFATNGKDGFEQWKSDGTIAGTTMIRDINPGPNSSIGHPDYAVVNNTLYFSAYTDTMEYELWKAGKFRVTQPPISNAKLIAPLLLLLLG